MTDLLTNSLLSMHITPPNKEYIDITNEFFSITETISYGTITESPSFKLVQGTHALEVLNPKLDSSLLTYTSYDVNKELTKEEAISIFMGMFRCVSKWLDNNLLSTTVLSCSYILNELKFYTYDNKNYKISKEINNWNDILKISSIGIIAFVRFILKLAMSGVVYEDEDINSQSMDLDYLTSIDNREILDLIKNAQSWCTATNCKEYSNLLLLLSNLIEIDEILGYKFNPFGNQFYPVIRELLDNKKSQFIDSIKLLNNLNIDNDENDHIPKGCFNVNAQRELNNRTPPKDCLMMDWIDTIKSFKLLFEDLIDLLITAKFNNIIELIEWLNYLMNKRVKTDDEHEVLGLHIIARAMLQLFLIKDNESIFGSDKYSILQLMYEYICKISLRNSSIDYNKSTDNELMMKFDELLENLKQQFYHYLTSVSQNPSRQRQFLNKQVILLDGLQAFSQDFEVSVNKDYPDIFPQSLQLILPVTSYIYYQKLIQMINVSLKSIELDLFKDIRELSIGYYILSFQIDYLIQQLNRLKSTIDFRLNQLISLNKKLKKSKGDKKLKLKNEYELKKKYSDEFKFMKNYFDYQLNKFSIYKDIIDLKFNLLQILKHLGYAKLPKNCKVPEKMLFELQWKSFQSIGLPQLPNFKDYEEETNKFNVLFNDLLKNGNINNLKILVQGKVTEVTEKVKNSTELMNSMEWRPELKSEVETDLQLLKREAVVSQLEFNNFVKLLSDGIGLTINNDNNNDNNELEVKLIRRGRHTYFPGISVKSKMK